MEEVISEGNKGTADEEPTPAKASLAADENNSVNQGKQGGKKSSKTSEDSLQASVATLPNMEFINLNRSNVSLYSYCFCQGQGGGTLVPAFIILVQK